MSQMCMKRFEINIKNKQTNKQTNKQKLLLIDYPKLVNGELGMLLAPKLRMLYEVCYYNTPAIVHSS